jgi:hypothetical protein
MDATSHHAAPGAPLCNLGQQPGPVSHVGPPPVSPAAHPQSVKPVPAILTRSRPPVPSQPRPPAQLQAPHPHLGPPAH